MLNGTKRMPKISQRLCVPRPWRKEESLSSIKPSLQKGYYLNAHKMSLLKISDSADREDLKGWAVLLLTPSARTHQYQPLTKYLQRQRLYPSMAECYSAPSSSILSLITPLTTSSFFLHHSAALGPSTISHPRLLPSSLLSLICLSLPLFQDFFFFFLQLTWCSSNSAFCWELSILSGVRRRAQRIQRIHGLTPWALTQ